MMLLHFVLLCGCGMIYFFFYFSNCIDDDDDDDEMDV